MSPAFDPIWLHCSLPSEVFEIKMQLLHFCTISDADSRLLLVRRETSEPSMQIMSALPAAFWAMDASITIAFDSRSSRLAEPTISCSHSIDKILLVLVTATASIT